MLVVTRDAKDSDDVDRDCSARLVAAKESGLRIVQLGGQPHVTQIETKCSWHMMVWSPDGNLGDSLVLVEDEVARIVSLEGEQLRELDAYGSVLAISPTTIVIGSEHGVRLVQR